MRGWVHTWLSRIAASLRLGRVDREFREELDTHLQLLIDEHVRRGLPPDEARRAAVLCLGAPTQLRESYREQSALPFVEQLVADVRYAFRLLRKSPGFTLAAVLTLALGTGANTAIFTVIDGLLLRLLPVAAPDRLVAIGDPTRVNSWSNGTPRTDLFSYPLYRELRDRNVVLSSVLATCRFDNVLITVDGSPEKVTGRLVTGNYFETLGVTATLGRTFTDADDRSPGADPFIVISHDFWERRFAADPSVVGREVRIKNVAVTIVGVAPPGFFGEIVGSRPDLWAPMMMEPTLMPGRNFLDKPDTSTLQLIGRLKDGVTLEQARDNITAVVKQALTETLASKLSADDIRAIQSGSQRIAVNVSPGARGLSRLRSQFSSPLLLLMAMVGVVMLVACINVANLLLARARVRQREIAVRLAIGAARGRIIRQLLTEALVLAFFGGAVGLLLAQWGAAVLVRWANGQITSPLVLSLDWPVLGFTAGICLVAGVLFGLAPAMRFSRVKLAPALTEAGRGGHGGPNRTAPLLITAQIALGIVLVTTASLLVRSLRNLEDVDLGYQRDHLLLTRIDLVGSGYKEGRAERLTQEIIDGLSTVPGVRAVTASSNGLFSGSESSDAVRVDGFEKNQDSDLVTNDDEVGANYFSTIGVPVVLGREITAQDITTRAHVAVVNEAFAQFYFKGRNPIGGRIDMVDSDHPDEPPFLIVGVAKNVRDHGVRAVVPRRMYAPLTSAAFDYAGALNFEIRAAGSPASIVAAVRAQLHRQDPNLVIDSVTTAGELIGDTLTSQALVADLSSCFGALVLVLICVGLYGTMSYSVAARTREIGLRMALGAPRFDVVWMIAREAGVMLAAGAAVGLPASVAAARLFKSMLFGVGQADAVSLGGAVGTLVTIAIVATVLPARRATRVDPMVALRCD